MCNARIITFAVQNLSYEEIEGKRILEVGSMDVIGSVRPVVERLNPKEYIGVDLEWGKGVDMLCDAEKLHEHFLADSFDVVISTETLEHVKGWQRAISNIKRLCKPNGVMLITTKMPSFPYHAYPNDYWRFSVQDFKSIFADCKIEKLETYPNLSILLKAIKPNGFKEIDISGYRVYSMPFFDKYKYLLKEFVKKWI